MRYVTDLINYPSYLLGADLFTIEYNNSSVVKHMGIGKGFDRSYFTDRCCSPSCVPSPSLLWSSSSVEQELYVLMRLHHVLCQRLGKAVILAEKAKALKEAQVSNLVYYLI